MARSSNIQKVEIKSGETLIVKINKKLTCRQRDDLYMNLTDSLPDGVKCIAFDDDIDFLVVGDSK